MASGKELRTKIKSVEIHRAPRSHASCDNPFV